MPSKTDTRHIMILHKIANYKNNENVTKKKTDEHEKYEIRFRVCESIPMVWVTAVCGGQDMYRMGGDYAKIMTEILK